MRFQSLERLSPRLTSNSAIDCPSTPAAPWLALTRLYASHTSRFGISNGFALFTRFLPLLVDPIQELNNATPSVQSDYRTFVPVGSEVARLRADHRPPLKLHVRFAACSFHKGSVPLRRKGRD